MVTTTNPPDGGTFTGPGTQTLDVNFNQAVDPTSVQDSDLMLSGVAATVTGHTLMKMEHDRRVHNKLHEHLLRHADCGNRGRRGHRWDLQS